MGNSASINEEIINQIDLYLSKRKSIPLPSIEEFCIEYKINYSSLMLLIRYNSEVQGNLLRIPLRAKTILEGISLYDFKNET